MTAKLLLRSKLAYVAPGRTVSDDDYDLLVTGSADIYKPDGTRLCCVRRRVISPVALTLARPSLRLLKNSQSRNRGVAAGGKAPRRMLADGTLAKTQEAMPVHSAVIGYFDRYPRIPYCRQTAFNADHPNEFKDLQPMFEQLAQCYAVNVPERFKAQMEVVSKTSQDFVIKGTPWTTITVNHNWQTSTHRDRGDLDAGFSCLTVLRSGHYRGGHLVFPAYRCAVDLRDGDFIMMDSHEFHANTPFEDASEDFERISAVLYYRTKMAECGTAEHELHRAKHLHGTIDLNTDEDGNAVTQ